MLVLSCEIQLLVYDNGIFQVYYTYFGHATFYNSDSFFLYINRGGINMINSKRRIRENNTERGVQFSLISFLIIITK